jgi:formylglycine-generating enzyme required for sulfatase activity
MVAFGVAAAAHADTITHGSTSVNIDFVTVGDPGNPDDIHGDGYGGVDYTYRIGTYEVTDSQWDAVAAADTSGLLPQAEPWSGNQPAARVSWYQAAMYTNWLTSGDVAKGVYAIDSGGVVTGIDRAAAAATFGTTYFLPTEDEWYKAAYYEPAKPGGAGYWDYPTRLDEPGAPDGIDSAGDPAFDAVFGPYNQGGPNDVDNAGLLSAYGTMGQGGNVWEWSETIIGSGRAMRGGAWDEQTPNSLHAASRIVPPPTEFHWDGGFRVASNGVPEPSTLVGLVGMGWVGLVLAWRRRRHLAQGHADVGRP